MTSIANETHMPREGHQGFTIFFPFVQKQLDIPAIARILALDIGQM